ncbi:MAG: hypothetical protein LBP53_02400 [Candidatus Peribacteria bacterium]|nr:hypothetical protein [Candidatus Peribacteria bacterium]
MIFVAVAILGIRMYAAITSRDELTSTATPANQLTAEKWDSLIDKVRQLEINTDALSGNIDTLSGTIETIYTGITDYVMGADEEYVDNKIDGLNESLTQWANNTFLT